MGRGVAGEPEVAASEASDMRPGERVGDPTLGVELSCQGSEAKHVCLQRVELCNSLFQGVGGIVLRRSQLGHLRGGNSSR